MTTSEWHVQTLLKAIHSITPQSLTLEQLERCLSAVRFAAPRWQDEYAPPPGGYRAAEGDGGSGMSAQDAFLYSSPP
jgi:hypothetical protein